MMIRWCLTAGPELLLRAVAGCLLNPLGYFKEIAYLSVALWLGSSVLTSINQEWYGEPSRHAAAAGSSTISRVIDNPYDGTLTLFRDFCEVVTLDRETHEELYRHAVPSVDRLEFGSNPDGWSFLTLTSGRSMIWRHSVLGAIELPPQQESSWVIDATLSPDGGSAAAVDMSGLVRHWRLQEDGSVTERQWSLSFKVCRVLLSPQGRILAVKTPDNSLSFFDAETGEQRTSPRQLHGMLATWKWSPAGAYLATATERGVIAVWNAERSEPLEWKTSLNYFPTALAITPDGRQLAVGTSTGEILAYRDGQPNWSQRTHPSFVRVLSFTDQEEHLLTGTIKGRLSVHSLATGAVLREFDATASR
jgi:WD40 repeat protein